MATGYGAGYAAPAEPAGRRGFDVLGLIGVILALIGLVPTLFVFLIGLIPAMNPIWWLLVAIIPMLAVGGAIVVVLGIIGLILGISRQRRLGLSITSLALGVLMLAPIALLAFSSVL